MTLEQFLDKISGSGFLAGLLSAASVFFVLILWYIYRRWIVKSARDQVLRNIDNQNSEPDLSKMNVIDREIYRSEILWRDKAGALQEKLFENLSNLQDSVSEFNTALKKVPHSVGTLIPSAVSSFSRDTERSGRHLNNAAQSLEKAAASIEQYAGRMRLFSNKVEDDSRKIIEDINKARRDHAEAQKILLKRHSEAISALVSEVEEQKKMLKKTGEEKRAAEKMLIDSLIERANKLSSNRLIIDE